MCIKKGTSQTMPLISRSHGIAKKPKNKSNNGKIILHKKKILINKKQLTVNDLVNNFVAAKVEPEEIIDNKIQVEKESQVRDGTRAFIAVMLHTLNCRYNIGTRFRVPHPNPNFIYIFYASEKFGLGCGKYPYPVFYTYYPLFAALFLKIGSNRLRLVFSPKIKKQNLLILLKNKQHEK